MTSILAFSEKLLWD